MDAATCDAARCAAPRTPYPGLRPFLDHEEMLLHGRDRQIREIIARLGSAVPRSDPAMPNAADGDRCGAFMRFVAVLGGSGSGKSSLIRAGVVPRLRQLGLPEVGDLWEAVICTPGSNFSRVRDAGGETPLTRLAREFDAVLRPPEGTTSSEERREAIAELLRQPGGLDSIVETYGPDLDLPECVDASQACVLLVIDQFEELFHPSNRGGSDVASMIERVIDHYHQARHGGGCPRCFVAITMRSEHLQDCAAWIGLPEAINAGAYLVSRLDRGDLHQVIERPAQRFLRLRLRASRGDPTLPLGVAFQPEVVERLVADTLAIKDSPDHLPLLQHILARLWQQACRREERPDGGVPEKLTWDDLLAAARLARPAEADRTNLLEHSLQAWAEHEFQAHAPEERTVLCELLRNLAYKDPINGTYTQQRYRVDSHPLGRERLHDLLDGRWIHSVNYLYWDDRSGGSLQLKVSHEAFIRGWRRFRDIVDLEAQRYTGFQRLLESCRDWLATDRRDRRLLLNAGQLQRLKMARIDEALEPPPGTESEPPLWKRWHAWTASSPLSTGLADVRFDDARVFYRHSKERLRRWRWLRGSSVPLAVFVTTVVCYSLFVQRPVVTNARMLIGAAETTNAARHESDSDEVGGSAAGLRALLDAQDVFHRAKADDRYAVGLRQLDALLSLDSLLPRTARTVEPLLNARLRAMLTEAVWLMPPPDGRTARRLAPAAPAPSGTVPCDVGEGRFFPIGSEPGGTQSGVFVPRELRVSSGSASLWKATRDPHGRCRQDREILSLPPADFHPAIVFDPDFSHLLVVTSAPEKDQSTVTASRLDWGSRRGIPPVTDIATIYGNDQVIAAARRQAESPEGDAAETWLVTGGRALAVGAQYWRLVQPGFSLLVQPPEADGLVPLLPVRDGTAGGCGCIKPHIATDLARIKGARGGDTAIVGIHDPGGSHCLVRLARPGADGEAGIARTTLRVYTKPMQAGSGCERGGELHVPLLAQIDLGEMPASAAWFAGRPKSRYDGWLVTASPAHEGGYLGVPWSTGALATLGKDVLQQHCRARGLQAGAPPSGACLNRATSKETP